MNRIFIFNICKRGVTGIGIGTFCLVLGELCYQSKAVISWREFLVYSLMSFLIAMYTYIFDIESLNYYLLFPIHFFLTFFTSVLVQVYLSQTMDLHFLAQMFQIFALIYLTVWVMLYLRGKIAVSQINRKISK